MTRYAFSQVKRLPNSRAFRRSEEPEIRTPEILPAEVPVFKVVVTKSRSAARFGPDNWRSSIAVPS